LGFEIVLSNLDLCQAALAWAARLGQAKAYDGFYLAVAQQKEAELWTADENLRSRLRQLGFARVRWIEEE
jgi:predicted nucleic acid-binding protein